MTTDYIIVLLVMIGFTVLCIRMIWRGGIGRRGDGTDPGETGEGHHHGWFDTFSGFGGDSGGGDGGGGDGGGGD